MSLRRHILTPPDGTVDGRLAQLLETVELERLARELHTTDHRLNRFDPADWAELMPGARSDCQQRAAVAVRLGNVGACNVALEKVAAVIALALAAPEPLSPAQAYTRSRAVAREAIDAWVGWLGRGA